MNGNHNQSHQTDLINLHQSEAESCIASNQEMESPTATMATSNQDDNRNTENFGNVVEPPVRNLPLSLLTENVLPHSQLFSSTTDTNPTEHEKLSADDQDKISLVSPFPNGFFRPRIPRLDNSSAGGYRPRFSAPRLQKRHTTGTGSSAQFKNFQKVDKAVNEVNPNHHVVKRISSTRCLTSVMERVTEDSRKKLEEYEFYPNWLNAKSEIQFTQYELDGMLSFLKNQGNEMNTIDNGEHKLLIFGLTPMICNNAQAFLKILQEDYAGADEFLGENNRLIDIGLNSNKSIVAKEYVTGLFYIIKGLKIIVESHMGSLGKEFSLDDFIGTQIEAFSQLSMKSKVAVWASKHFFLKLIRDKEPLVYKEMNELASLDPDYYEWRMYHYLAIREGRRIRHGVSSVPEDGEIQALQNAWNLVPTNPLCLMYMGIAAAECLRLRPFLSHDRPLSFGQFDFVSTEEAVTFIKQNCLLLALRINPQCIRVNILIAHVLAYLLPFKYRDLNMARECIFQAYRSGQDTSSKANHRLAIYMLGNIKTQSSNTTLTMCETHLEKAFNLDKRNVEALFNLLQVYLSQPKECEHKIRMLFSVQLHNLDLTRESMAKLNFLKGCFHMMIDDPTSALSHWVTAYNLQQFGGLNFKMLQTNSYIFRTFGWNIDKLNLKIAISETQKVLESLLVTTSSDSYYKNKTILVEILELQHDALSTGSWYCNKVDSDSAE